MPFSQITLPSPSPTESKRLLYMVQPNIVHLFLKHFKICVSLLIHWPLPLMWSPLFQTEIPFSSSSTQILPFSWSQHALLSLWIPTETYMFSMALLPYKLIQWLYVCIASPPLPLGTVSLTSWLHALPLKGTQYTVVEWLNILIMSLGLDVVLILRQLVIRPTSVNLPIGFPGSSVPKDERLSIQ